MPPPVTPPNKRAWPLTKTEELKLEREADREAARKRRIELDGIQSKGLHVVSDKMTQSLAGLGSLSLLPVAVAIPPAIIHSSTLPRGMGIINQSLIDVASLLPLPHYTINELLALRCRALLPSDLPQFEEAIFAAQSPQYKRIPSGSSLFKTEIRPAPEFHDENGNFKINFRNDHSSKSRQNP